MGNKAAVWLLSLALIVVYLLVFLAVGYVGLMAVYLLLAVLGSMILIFARYAIKDEATVTLRGVGVEYALRVTGHALYAAEDNTVGFPSGKFEVADGPGPLSILANEFRPKSSHKLVLRMILVPWAVAGMIVWGVAEATDSLAAFAFAQGVRVVAFTYFMFFFIVPMALALLVELLLKKFVASVITVQAAEGDNEVELHFTFQGASALLAKKRLMSTFEAPVLPAKFHTPAMALAAQTAKAGAAA